jgi:hypothetical protein
VTCFSAPVIIIISATLTFLANLTHIIADATASSRVAQNDINQHQSKNGNIVAEDLFNLILNDEKVYLNVVSHTVIEPLTVFYGVVDDVH